MTEKTQPPQDTVSIQLDGTWVRVPKGTNVIEAAKRHGRFIPHYCYHPKLEIAGNCRMCLVEIGMPRLGPDRQPVRGADGMPEIAWIPRPQIGCATTVSDGMGVRTASPLVEECRRGVMEFLLINHPLDCPICDQAGECKLQEFSLEYGSAASRFIEQKVKKPKHVDIGKNILLDDERCILCSRCIRFARDIAKEDVLGFTQRGSQTTLSIHPGRRFDSNYSLNAADICPVGALTSKDFRFKMRVWFLKETNAICTSCGTGCNIVIGSREGAVHRLTPRENDAVNQCWMCDHGRLNFHHLHAPDRIKAPTCRLNGHALVAEWPDALSQLSRMLGNLAPDEIAILASSKMTNEELFLLSLLRDRLGGDSVPCDVLPRRQEADHLLVCDDGNPNSTGARLLGISSDGKRLPDVIKAIESGRTKAVLAISEDLADAGITQPTIARIPTLATIAILPNATTSEARFVLPGAGFAEKRGSMINVKGRIQRLNRATPPPANARDDWQILTDLLALLDAPHFPHIDAVFAAMAARHPALAGLTLAGIGDLGQQLARK
ncbi:MAG TPA: 2Fe-2S iron-sulfur cluster-binding protein [Verrucomicrobiae bacterium]|nr:2Fe-2S iron-sulfur cluster-binding protein [Verrucomicrobiae bacterium]